MPLEYIVFGFTISLLINQLLMRPVMKVMRKRGWIGVDVHKYTRVECVEPGGIVVLISVTISLTILLLSGGLFGEAIGAILSIILIGLIGLVDDNIELRQRYKVLLTILAGLPLAISYNESGNIRFPVIGVIVIGMITYRLTILLGISISSNLTNMLAGFNGLEAGFATVACGTLGLICLIEGNLNAAALAFTSLGALLSYLRYNWYPAKVFPGDTGSLLFGTIIWCIAVLGKVEFIAISLMMPAILDFALKALFRRPFAQRSIYGDTKVDEKGILHPPGYPALSHAFMKMAPTSEKRLVSLILITELLLFLSGSLIMALFS